MIVTVVLEQEDFNHMHDVILEVLDVEPTQKQIQEIWDKLPDDIKGTAIEWGCSDTVFRENLYVWLKDTNFKFEDEPSYIGKVINAEILSSDKKARISGGLYITFLTSVNVLKDAIVNIVVDGRWTAFKVTDVSIDGDNLSVRANEYSYWASKLDRIQGLDLRTLVGLDVSLVTDEETKKTLYTQSCWC